MKQKFNAITMIITKYITSEIMYFLSTSLLISLIANIIFKLFGENIFSNYLCPYFYFLFYFFPVIWGYLLANKLKLLENDVEALTAYDKSIYGAQSNLSSLRKKRLEKKNEIIKGNDEYNYIGIFIILYLFYLLYTLIFTIILINKGYLILQ